MCVSGGEIAAVMFVVVLWQVLFLYECGGGGEGGSAHTFVFQVGLSFWRPHSVAGFFFMFFSHVQNFFMVITA